MSDVQATAIGARLALLIHGMEDMCFTVGVVMTRKVARGRRSTRMRWPEMLSTEDLASCQQARRGVCESSQDDAGRAVEDGGEANKAGRADVG